MFDPPDHQYNFSLTLSEVLSDIGVNRRVVMRRRSGWLLTETLVSIGIKLRGENKFVIHFGSQSEGSTTRGLASDVDRLWCYPFYQVIQDWLEWQPGKEQYLMVQDNTTSPGYCLLQAVRLDVPIFQKDVQCEHMSRDISGRILASHSVVIPNAKTRHGPAIPYHGGHDIHADNVPAIWCQSWPKEADHWLHQINENGWPTECIKRYAAENGCFVVAVASREGINQDTEWRISTSFAERCLMFSLNLTQIRCYILMKMIINTYLKPKYGESISSFMCKNVLFRCIAGSRACEWNDSTLLICFNRCLQGLFDCILTGNCPHFIIPGNNLLAGKLSFYVKQQLVETMSILTENLEQSLLGVSVDDLGIRIQAKSSRILAAYFPTSEQIADFVLEETIIDISNILQIHLKYLLAKIYQNNNRTVYQGLINYLSELCHLYSRGSKIEQIVCRLYFSRIPASIGSIIASADISMSQEISSVALEWFSAGINSDLCSSKIKLASALYCAGQNELCEIILSSLSRQFESTIVLSQCACYSRLLCRERAFERICQEKNEEDIIQQNMAFCVTFLPCEDKCVPKELMYEFFRSIQQDLIYRGDYDVWMNWAVVDTLSYLYFLQYKVYSRLYRPVEQHRALYKLIDVIITDVHLGHRETALNLLGQCMEQENIPDMAFYCYTLSLKVRNTNNAAKWHTCRLLARLLSPMSQP